MKQDSRCLVFNIMRILAVLFANFLIIKSFYFLLSNPNSSISRIEYAYMLLGFIMLFGATFASKHEFCEDDKHDLNMSDHESIKDVLERRNNIKNKQDELNNRR